MGLVHSKRIYALIIRTACSATTGYIRALGKWCPSFSQLAQCLVGAVHTEYAPELQPAPYETRMSTILISEEARGPSPRAWA